MVQFDVGNSVGEMFIWFLNIFYRFVFVCDKSNLRDLFLDGMFRFLRRRLVLRTVFGQALNELAILRRLKIPFR